MLPPRPRWLLPLTGLCALLLLACADRPLRGRARTSATAAAPPDQPGPPKQPATTGARVALVVGNGTYRSSARLRNPPGDARAVAAKLRTMGFDTAFAVDTNKAGLERALREFSRRMADADVALFYYAGHGLQVGGHNYLVPTDATLQDEADVPYEAVDVQNLLDAMQTRARV